MKREIVRLAALDYAATLAGEDFNTVFCRITGCVGADAKHKAGASYPVEEVAELFSALFDVLQGANSETPAVGAAGES